MRWILDLDKSGNWLLGFIGMFFLLDNIGIMEGLVWPVDINTTLDSVEDIDADGWAEVGGSFEKLRNCTLHSLEWYWVGEDNDVRVHVRRTNTPIRGEGQHTFSQLMIHMPHNEIRDNSYAIAYHKCHPLWKTETKFYP